MPPKTGRKHSTKKAGELRRSQIVAAFGPGAVADLPHFSGIISGTDNWNIGLLSNDAKIREGNLEKLLGMDFFIQVSSSTEDVDGSFGIPMFRFPYIYYCPECHMLDYYWNIALREPNNSKNSKDFFCNACSRPGHRVKLIPSRFIVSCLNGHLEDFPYSWWVHRNHKHDVEGAPQLSLEYDSKTGGLDGIHIKCNCKAEETMAGCMNKDALRGLHCRGKMPWIANDYIDPEECLAKLRTMQRSANNVYYAVNQSALTIPPWSSQIHKVFKKHSEILEDIFDEDEESILITRLKKHWLKYQNEYSCLEDTFIREAKAVFGRKETEGHLTEKAIIENEYLALCAHDSEDPYFTTSSESIPKGFEDLFEQVKLVKRLREVQVIRGFRRILPEHEMDEAKRKEEGIFEREFTPISKQPMNWLPAIELFGEGIFIKFKENALAEWEARNSARYTRMAAHLQKSWIGKGMFSAKSCRYVLMHTFTHLLIHQLSSQCGYSTASLKEKIYASYLDSERNMGGVLVYTAATDCDGSLGGLVRQGQQEKLTSTIRALLQNASWCSNDPLCIESMAQGYQSLNYAACHACTLLPETSCEAANCLLDRAAIVGTPDNRDMAFFKNMM